MSDKGEGLVERLRHVSKQGQYIAPDTVRAWCEPELTREAADRITALETEVKRLTEESNEAVNEIEAAKRDLRSFMTTFVREHFPHVPQWKPLPDLLGMLSQMDNASTIARDYAAKLKLAEAALEPFAEHIKSDITPERFWDMPMCSHEAHEVTIADFRRARLALHSIRED